MNEDSEDDFEFIIWNLKYFWNYYCDKLRKEFEYFDLDYFNTMKTFCKCFFRLHTKFQWIQTSELSVNVNQDFILWTNIMNNNKTRTLDNWTIELRSFNTNNLIDYSFVCVFLCCPAVHLVLFQGDNTKNNRKKIAQKKQSHSQFRRLKGAQATIRSARNEKFPKP